jgi:hypothetical protein
MKGRVKNCPNVNPSEWVKHGNTSENRPKIKKIGG